MAGHHHIGLMFEDLEFHVSGEKIEKKCMEKVKALEDKISVRKSRIAKIREEHRITDADLIELLSENARNEFANHGTYTLHTNKPANASGEDERIIPAGAISNFNTENTAMGKELTEVERLKLIVRNIDTEIKHELGFDELEYLGL